MLVAVAGVLDQLALGLLEALGLSAAALDDRAGGLVDTLLGGRLGADTAADRAGFGGGLLGLLTGWIWRGHRFRLTRSGGPQTATGSTHRSIHAGRLRAQAEHPRAELNRLAHVQSLFRLEVRNEARATVIALSGELDLASSPALQEELDRAAASDTMLVIIDLRELDFMDSTGLSVLVRAHQRTEEQGRQLAMVKGPQQVQRLLSLTGVSDRLTVVDRPEDLLGSD